MNPITRKLTQIATKAKAAALDTEDSSMMDEPEQEVDIEIPENNVEILEPTEDEKSYTYVGKDGELCRLQPGEEFIDPHTPEANPESALTRDEQEEDTSGNTYSQADSFLEKYANGDDIIQCLRKDLMSILSDIQWIKESNNENEQWALDFVDALNELSVSL